MSLVFPSGGKESLLYFGGWPLKEKGTHVQRPIVPLLIRGVKAFKGEFQGCIGRGKRLHADTVVSSNSHLENNYTVV